MYWVGLVICVVSCTVACIFSLLLLLLLSACVCVYLVYDLIINIYKLLDLAANRSSTRRDLVVSPTVTYFGARSFAVAGPKAWNHLPADILAMEPVISFKSALKTFLFRWLLVQTRHVAPCNDFVMVRHGRNCQCYCVIMKSSKMPFLLYPRWKKADNIPHNNLNQFKRTFIIFGRQH